MVIIGLLFQPNLFQKISDPFITAFSVTFIANMLQWVWYPMLIYTFSHSLTGKTPMSFNVTLYHRKECTKYFFLVVWGFLFVCFTYHGIFDFNSFNPPFSHILEHRLPSVLLLALKPCLVWISYLLKNFLYACLCFVASTIPEDPSNWALANGCCLG